MARGNRGGSRPASRTAPPPAPRAAAPPPSTHHTQQQGGLMSGLAGMVMQGAAMGTGSAMAHRAVDSVMGPRTVVHEGAPAQEAAAPAQMGPCGAQMKAFNQCLETSDGDLSRCQLVMDALQSCKRGGF